MSKADSTRYTQASPLLSRLVPILLVAVTCLGGIALSLARDAQRDETIYLHESAIMAECLRAGEWFGNESVGLHGFVYKLPGALLFLAFGRSVFLATLVTVALAGLAAWLCYRLLQEILDSPTWAAAGTWLLATNFQFLRLMPTYNRDIPALVSMLLFIHAVLHRRNRWIVGLLLLLILDTKEYLFFMVLPAFGLWVLLEEWQARQGRSLLTVLHRMTTRWTAGALPAVVYLVLMFTTGIVPLNMFAARVLGLDERETTPPVIVQFSPDKATRNTWKGSVTPSEQPAPGSRGATAALQGNASTKPAGRLITAAGQYARKLFYPTVFSFDGIPKVMALPAILMSLLLAAQWRRERRPDLLRLIILLWVFLGIFVAMAGYPRYMLPVFPLLILFFLAFLKDGVKRPVFPIVVLTLTVVFVAGGVYFNRAGLWKKVVVNGFMIGLLVVAAFLARRRFRTAAYLAPAVALVFGVLCLAASLNYAFTHRYGQIANFRLFGRNHECRRVLAAFPPDDHIWINDTGWRRLPQFFRPDRPETPEWQGVLKDWVPKKRLLNHYPESRTCIFSWFDDFDLRKKIRRHGIDRLGLVVSHIPARKFSYQDQLDLFRAKPWLELEQTAPLKNKTLYVFRYIEM